MPREAQVLVYVGIAGAVVALDDVTGTEVWRAPLRGSDYVSVLWDGEALLASTDGEVWRLDATTGAEIWHNQLKGMGRGLTGLASARRRTVSTGADTDAAQHYQDRQRAAAAAG